MEKSLKKQTGARIRAILKEKGWKQADLARKTGMTPARISLILSGEKNLTLDTVESLEETLESPILQVYGTSIKP
jgi:transcriptional regulator with XRE-family HTH domain